jgi:hypothetical protein
MALLEKSLAGVESRVTAQLSLIEDIPTIVADAKYLFTVCQNMPDPDPDESGNVVLALRKSTSKQNPAAELPPPLPAAKPKATPPTPVVRPTKAKAPLSPPVASSIDEGEAFVHHITEEELKNLSRSAFFRVSLAKANAWIDEINVILEKKAALLRAAPSGRAQTKRTLERYEAEKLEGDSRLFFTLEDVKEMPTLRNNQKNALTMLQSLGRIYTSTDSHLKRWFVK